jgi:threonine dehydratase
MESWQITGSFKVRGAVNMVSALSKEERAKGLVTASSGNHGTALSYAANIFEKPPTRVYLPKTADPKKVEKIKSFGAEPILHGENYPEALDEAQRFANETNSTYVHSHSHPLIIAGQGTIGLEIVEDLSDLDTVLVQIGGGGLISGISTAIKTVNNQAKIIGVEPTAAPGAFQSFKDGYCHERIEIKPSIADGLLGTLTPLTFKISKRHVRGIVLVEDNEIINAMKTLQSAEQLMVEGSAATGLAAILANKIQLKNEKVVIILTGRNIDSQRYNRLVNT